MRIWLLIVATGAITFGLRLSFIWLAAGRSFPARARQLLSYVAPAVLAAIVVPGLVASQGSVDLSLGNPRLLAGAAAIAVAWKTRDALITTTFGMLALWGIQWLR